MIPSPAMRVLLCLLPVCLVAGCAEAEVAKPRWIHLARGFEPQAVEGVLASWGEGGNVRMRREPAETGVWVEHDVQPHRWRKDPNRADQWFLPRPKTAGFQHHDGERVELRLGTRLLPEIPEREKNFDSHETGEGLFFVSGQRVVVRLPDGETPDDLARYASYLPRGESIDGVWRTMVKGVVADGLSVWPGESAEIRCDVQPDSVLRFQTLAQSIGPAGKAVFRVSLDGELLFRGESEIAVDEPEETHHEVALPLEGRDDARLLFEVRGVPSFTAFLNPVIGPAPIGVYGERPWGETTPDIVVFLVDTFRADNLAVYGGDPAVAPHMNALADRSVRFLNARSPGVWTLPSHGSLFTGLLPPQHGAVQRSITFSRDLVTIAEHLAARGYRTGAVTDSGYVSRYYELDQGFEWFTESEYSLRKLASTFEKALEFLDRDDGRPVFLFVHTYRAHYPYRQGAEEDPQACLELMDRAIENLRERRRKEDPKKVLAEFLEEYYALYKEGVNALDAEFGPWFAELERRRLFERGAFLLTSDHGEEFYEHGGRQHGGPPHEEKIRIPLLIHGAGLLPRDVLPAASLIDVPPTLSRLAGLPPHEAWIGQPLLSLARERPHFAYNQDDDRTYLAIVDGTKKVFSSAEADVLEKGELDAAYDLATDPGETENLVDDELWPKRLGSSVAAAWAHFSIRIGDTSAVELSAELEARLRELGYVE